MVVYLRKSIHSLLSVFKKKGESWLRWRAYDGCVLIQTTLLPCNVAFIYWFAVFVVVVVTFIVFALVEEMWRSLVIIFNSLSSSQTQTHRSGRISVQDKLGVPFDKIKGFSGFLSDRLNQPKSLNLLRGLADPYGGAASPIKSNWWSQPCMWGLCVMKCLLTSSNFLGSCRPGADFPQLHTGRALCGGAGLFCYLAHLHIHKHYGHLHMHSVT